MKSRSTAVLIICLTFILAACGKKTDPAEAAAAFIEGTIYYRTTEETEKYFYRLNGEEKQLTENFKTAFNLTDEQAEELTTIYRGKMSKETSFSTELIEESKEVQLVEATIVGLDQSHVEQDLEEQTDLVLAVFLQKKGHSSIKTIEDIDKVTEEEELQKLADTLDQMTDEEYTAIQYEALKQVFQGLKASEDPGQKVQIRLQPDKKEKKYWQVVDEEETFQALLDAFQG